MNLAPLMLLKWQTNRGIAQPDCQQRFNHPRAYPPMPLFALCVQLNSSMMVRCAGGEQLVLPISRSACRCTVLAGLVAHYWPEKPEMIFSCSPSHGAARPDSRAARRRGETGHCERHGFAGQVVETVFQAFVQAAGCCPLLLWPALPWLLTCAAPTFCICTPCLGARVQPQLRGQEQPVPGRCSASAGRSAG